MDAPVVRAFSKQAFSGLWPIFLVALAVALATTIVASVVQQFRQVSAEDLNVAETAATTGPAGTQVLTIAPWGVQLTLPLAPQSTRLSYADQAGASVGLSSADLEKLGPNCLAAHSALGSLVRLPHGGFDAAPHGSGVSYFIGTVGGYDYSYQLPAAVCANSPAASTVTNREEDVINTNLSSLSAVGN